MQLVMVVNIKRQVGLFSVYSSGIVFLFLGNAFIFSWSFSFFYLFISNLFLFLYIYCLILIRDLITGHLILKNVFNFSIFCKKAPFIAFCITLVFISLLGLPPLVGFFPKFFFLYCLANNMLIVYILFFLISTFLVIFSFVYLLKEMFFSILSTNFVPSIELEPISLSN